MHFKLEVAIPWEIPNLWVFEVVVVKSIDTLRLKWRTVDISFLVESFLIYFVVIKILVHIVVEPWATCYDNIGIVDFGNIVAYGHVWSELIICCDIETHVAE